MRRRAGRWRWILRRGRSITSTWRMVQCLGADQPLRVRSSSPRAGRPWSSPVRTRPTTCTATKVSRSGRRRDQTEAPWGRKDGRSTLTSSRRVSRTSLMGRRKICLRVGRKLSMQRLVRSTTSTRRNRFRSGPHQGSRITKGPHQQRLARRSCRVPSPAVLLRLGMQAPQWMPRWFSQKAFRDRRRNRALQAYRGGRHRGRSRTRPCQILQHCLMTLPMSARQVTSASCLSGGSGLSTRSLDSCTSSTKNSVCPSGLHRGSYRKDGRGNLIAEARCIISTKRRIGRSGLPQDQARQTSHCRTVGSESLMSKGRCITSMQRGTCQNGRLLDQSSRVRHYQMVGSGELMKEERCSIST
mmetsp:Transcript_133376/g.345197  ORF Transcript_133376/g.345197 Transcript_133376/m.345197 type:complete len:356 (+) Transcript_133376:3116-4183(+)